MKSKHIIIITLLIPFILILLWFGMKIKPLPDYNKITEYSSEEFSFYGDDATLLPGEYIIPETISSKRSIFLIADQKLDRNWNSRNMEFQTGRKISHILGQNGIPSVIYDQRGTGESVLSGKNHPTPENLASDFHIIYKKSTAKNFIHSDGIEIIAHGHSCIPALLAVNQFQIPVQRIYLLSCVFPGTLLDSWLEQILNNMRRAGVDDTAVSEGETIIQKWKKQDQFNLLTEGETNASADQKNQDIQSLYRALDYMQSEQMLPWTNQAKNISFLNE
ncbi:MAG: hypothetical protein OEZ34_11275, partial [Spirochaetia bacterium]|nr:hypothetical protein [Spirochaetia bacterium]